MKKLRQELLHLSNYAVVYYNDHVKEEWSENAKAVENVCENEQKS